MLTRLIDSFNALPDGTRELVLLALGIALPAAGALLLWVSSVSARHFRVRSRARKAARRQIEEAIARRREPANPRLGLYDHAVRVHPAIAQTLTSIRLAGDQFAAINDSLVKRAGEFGDADDHVKKQKLLQRFAKELKPHIVRLQATARSMESGAKAAVDGYRVLFSEAMIQRPGDALWLCQEKARFEQVADSFPTAIRAMTGRRDSYALCAVSDS